MSKVATHELTLSEHLRELRRRLFLSAIITIVGALIAYIFRSPLIRFLEKPLNLPLYYTSPSGSFEFVMQLCVLTGFIVALPVFVYNILRFIEPAFKRGFSRRLVTFVLFSSISLAFLGLAFGYYVGLPPALGFFRSVGTANLHPLISVNEYFSFLCKYLGAFAIIFQIPLILLFTNHIRPFGPKGLSKYRKYVVVAAFAVAIFLPSAPTPQAQIILAAPVIILYEMSIVLIWATNRRKTKAAKEEAAGEETEQVVYASPEVAPLPAAPVPQLVPVPVEVSDVPEVTDEPVPTPSPQTGRIIDGFRAPARRTLPRAVRQPKQPPLSAQLPAEQPIDEQTPTSRSGDLFGELLGLPPQDT
ncbi:MAG TPA: twin-arginine translocase subunit TatC [Candidatus Saccharimonadales bacterium]|nr:twin-arginine translocase subunit TatC [Candidatus Saccharimonadales bacterium]